MDNDDKGRREAHPVEPDYEAPEVRPVDEGSCARPAAHHEQGAHTREAAEAAGARERAKADARLEAERIAAEARARTGASGSQPGLHREPGTSGPVEHDEDVTPRAREIREATQGQTAVVQDEPLPRRRYVARAGDTLITIAREQLGDESRWRELYQFNRETLSAGDPDVIEAGMVLDLPD